MHATRLDVLRLTAGIFVASLVAACSVGAATAPPSVAPAASQAPAAASVAPSTSSVPSSAPSASPAPSSTAVAQGGGGRYGPPPSAKPTSKPAPTPKPAPTLTIKTGSTSLGTVLVTSDGFTLYFHAGDSSTHSSCTGGCASAWPPLLVKAGTKVKGGSGASGKFATFKRADGTTQVTYNGHPLYSWTGDYSPGDTTGQGIGGFSIAKA
jgi:predicted lipoprotein with Yx(FWY)xxD motif